MLPFVSSLMATATPEFPLELIRYVSVHSWDANSIYKENRQLKKDTLLPYIYTWYKLYSEILYKTLPF